MDGEQKVVPCLHEAWQYKTLLMSSREGYFAESPYCLYIIIDVTELFTKEVRKRDLHLPQVYIQDKRQRIPCEVSISVDIAVLHCQEI